MRHRAALGLIVLLALLLTGSQRAEAGLRFCNQANFKFNVAVGYVDREKGWVGKGWTVIEGGQCKDALTIPLNNRYYYFFAQGRGPDRQMVTYSGETPFCIQFSKFLLFQSQYGKNSQEECSKAGLLSQMFQKIDVSGKPDFIVNLRGPDGGSTGPSAGPAPRPVPPPANAGPPPQPPQPPTNRPSTANVAPPPRPAPPAARPPANQAPAAPSPACQRYPNLC